MPLPNIKAINDIFDEYMTSLNHQSSFKKTGTAVINTVRSFLPANADNEYIQKNLEAAKKDKIGAFKKAHETANTLPNENEAVLFWINHLKNLQEEFTKSKQAQIYNEPKYTLAIQTVRNIICTALEEYSLFKTEINRHETELQKQEQTIANAESAGFPIMTHLTQERNRLLLELTHLGHRQATIKAAKLGLLDEFDKPEKDKFISSASYNAVISAEVEIHPDVPWVYQRELPNLYQFRLERHSFPRDLREWEEWKNTKLVEGKTIEEKRKKELEAKLVEEKNAEEKRRIELEAKLAEERENEKKSLSSTSDILQHTANANLNRNAIASNENKEETPLLPATFIVDSKAEQQVKKFKTEDEAISALLDSLGIHGKNRKTKKAEFKNNPTTLQSAFESKGIVIDPNASARPGSS